MSPGVVVGGPVISTSTVAAGEAFEFWEATMAASVVSCSVEPVSDSPFYGWLRPVVHAPTLSVSVAATARKHGWRTKRHIDQVPAPTIVAAISRNGRGSIGSGDTVLRFEPGAMFLFDSTAVTDTYNDDYEVVLAHIPRAELVARSRIDSAEFPAVAVIPPTGLGALMIGYFERLAELGPGALTLPSTSDTAVDLLAAALAAQAGRRPCEQAARAMERQRLLRFLRANITDPHLTVDAIARGCLVSRRTLYRLVDDVEGGPMAVLRRLRIQRACEILTREPHRTVASVALDCGFTGERHFHRVFRRETGTTPAAYREEQARTGGATG